MSLRMSDDRKHLLKRNSGNSFKLGRFTKAAASLWFMSYLRRKRQRALWTRKWLSRRQVFGAYENLMMELKRDDLAGFLNFLRVSPEIFDYLLEKVKPYISKLNTKMRKAISPGLRLAITLRYLATGRLGFSRFLEYSCKYLDQCK